MRLSLCDPWISSAPEPGAPIDWSSDHADALVGFWPCWGAGTLQGAESRPFAEDLIHGNHAGSTPVLGSPAYASGEAWSCLYDPIAFSSHYLTFPTTPVFNLPTFSCFVRARVLVGGAYKGILSCRTAGNNGFQFTSESTSSSTYQPHLVVANAAGTEIKNVKTSGSYALPFAGFMAMLWTWNGTTARFWLDGVEQAVVASGDGGYGATGNKLMNAYNGIAALAYDFRIYSRARPELGPQLYDPSTRWDLFRTPRATIRLFSATATASWPAAILPAM